VTLPPKVAGPTGAPVPITATADGSNVVWLTPDAGLVVIDGSYFGGDSKKALLFAPAGTYRLWAVTAKGDVISQKAESIITIGAPMPPGPPGPPPTPDPVPDPALSKALSAAYALDADPDRATSLAFLKGCYGQLATMVGTSGVKTNTDALAWIQLKIAKPGVGLTPTQLVNTRKAIGRYMVSTFGTDPSAIVDLSSLAAELSKISLALSAVQSKGGK
jgi:hypothetical protein